MLTHGQLPEGSPKVPRGTGCWSLRGRCPVYTQGWYCECDPARGKSAQAPPWDRLEARNAKAGSETCYQLDRWRLARGAKARPDAFGSLVTLYSLRFRTVAPSLIIRRLPLPQNSPAPTPTSTRMQYPTLTPRLGPTPTLMEQPTLTPTLVPRPTRMQ